MANRGNFNRRGLFSSGANSHPTNNQCNSSNSSNSNQRQPQSSVGQPRNPTNSQLIQRDGHGPQMRNSMVIGE
jgi:hypothetical protein